MKKYLLLSFFICLAPRISTVALTQDRIVIKLSPGLCYGRVHTNPDTACYESEGVTFRGMLGGSYDWVFKENYSASTGLFFVAKELGIKHKKASFSEHHEIQYLQIPAILKLYTSELDLDLRAYGQLGLSIAFKVNERITNLTEGKDHIAKDFRFWELGASIGGGIEYAISLETSLFAGITYHPALSSIIRNEEKTANLPRLYGYTDMMTLDLGVRF